MVDALKLPSAREKREEEKSFLCISIQNRFSLCFSFSSFSFSTIANWKILFHRNAATTVELETVDLFFMCMKSEMFAHST